MSCIQKYIYYRDHLDAFRRLNNAEVLAILRIKRSFKNYCEKDETLRYKGCIIEITYHSTSAYIYISYAGEIRERELEFDEVSETIKDYR